jgi:hypothetical protein
MRKTLVSILTLLGAVSLLVSLMSAYYAVISFLDRSNNGSGLIWADVEIFSAITIFFIIIGSAALWTSYRIKRNPPPDDNTKSEIKYKN